MPSPFYCFPFVSSVTGTSEHSCRGVLDREKEVSCGVRKQLHLCVLDANRTQVTEIRVFSKGSLTYCRTRCMSGVCHAFQVSCSFSLCLLQHKPPAPGRLTTFSWHSVPTLLISSSVFPYSHTAAAPCQPHHSSASCTSTFSLSLPHALFFCPDQ